MRLFSVYFFTARVTKLAEMRINEISLDKKSVSLSSFMCICMTTLGLCLIITPRDMRDEIIAQKKTPPSSLRTYILKRYTTCAVLFDILCEVGVACGNIRQRTVPLGLFKKKYYLNTVKYSDKSCVLYCYRYILSSVCQLWRTLKDVNNFLFSQWLLLHLGYRETFHAKERL